MKKKRFEGGLKQRFMLVQKCSKHANISVCKLHFVVMFIYTDDIKAVNFYFKFEMLMVPLCWFALYQCRAEGWLMTYLRLCHTFCPCS